MVFEAIGEFVADLVFEDLFEFVGDLRGEALPLPLPLRVRLRLAGRQAARRRPVVLPVRVRYAEGRRRRSRWSRALVRVGPSGAALARGPGRPRSWSPLPGNGHGGKAEVVSGQLGPRGWPVLVLDAPDQPVRLLAAHPLVLVFVARVLGATVRSSNDGLVTGSGSPRHRTGTRSGRARHRAG